MMKISPLILPLVVSFLFGCQTIDRPHPTASKEALDLELAQASDANTKKQLPPPAVLPMEVETELKAQDLLAAAGVSGSLGVERRFDVSASEVEAKVFFPSLVAGTPFSVAVHPDVAGTISLSLKAVTLSEAIQVVEDIYGYEVSREGKILRIFPSGMRTQTFALNYLDMERQGLSMTSVTSGRISDQDSNGSGSNSGNSNSSNSNNSSNNSGSNGSSGSDSSTSNGTFIASKTKSDFWRELQKTLESIVGSTTGGRQVVISSQAGLVTVRAYPNELRQIRRFLKTAEEHLQRQVILEAKVLEVTLSDGYQQGINWAVLGHTGRTDISFGTTAASNFGDAISTALGGTASIGVVREGDFSAVVNLLDTQGDVDVLSSPRVTASNNQKAVIKVGTDEYFVTEVSSTTVAGNNPVTTPEVELTPFFSGIALDVTPQIDGEGNVLLHVHPSVNTIKEQIKTVKVGGETLELPLAKSDIRESDTVIKAASGDVVVIGGLMKSDSQEQISKVPVLGDIPLLGEAFTNKSQSIRKTELVILLKPIVVESDTWKKELQRSKKLLDRWYPNEK